MIKSNNIWCVKSASKWLLWFFTLSSGATFHANATSLVADSLSIDSVSYVAIDKRITRIVADQAKIDSSLKVAIEKLDQSTIEPSSESESIWIKGLLIFTVILTSLVLIIWQSINQPSKKTMLDELKQISSNLKDIKESYTTGYKPIIDEVKVENIESHDFFIITGKYFEPSSKVTFGGAECLVHFDSVGTLRALIPTTVGKAKDYVIVMTNWGLDKKKYDYAKIPMEIIDAKPNSNGGWTKVEGTGFTPNTKVQIALSNKTEAVVSGYLDEKTLIVNWPPANGEKNSKIIIRREDKEKETKDFDYK